MHLIDQQLNLMIRGRFKDAWAIAEELEAKHPNDPRAKFNRGWFLINQGKFQEGFQCLEYGRSLSVYGGPKLNTTKPIWDGSDLNGKTVIINLEGGYGDNIISARFATQVAERGGICILRCDRSLHSLFQRIPGVKSCIIFEEVSVTYHDYWIPGFSCSWLFGHMVHNIPKQPYIFADKQSIDIWKNILDMGVEKPKIGIRWSGNPKFEHQQFRIFPPKKLINLSQKFNKCQFFSLQKDNDLIELPDDVIDLQHLLISWEDTAACIANLDLVISSCTSVAHLSAAMGKPTWLIIPILPYHIWAYGDEHSAWYEKTTRVFRQQAFGNWDEPFEKIEKELGKLFNK